MIDFLRRINPFKRVLNIPIHVVPGGTQPWNDRQPPKKQRFPVLGCFMILMCSVSTIGGVAIQTITSNSQPTATPTMDWRELPHDELAGYLIASTWIATEAHSPTPSNTWTPTPTFTPTLTPRLTLTSALTPTVAPTITHAWTQTPHRIQQEVTREVTRVVNQGVQNVIITAPPLVVRETVEVVIVNTVVVVEQIVVTATPSMTIHPPDVVITQPPPLLVPPHEELNNVSIP